MRRVGLFGGSFNPVHVAHLLLAERALDEAGLERVVFMPARRPPHKPEMRLAPDADRLEMLRLATADNPRFEVSALELEREGPSYTLATVREIKAPLGPETALCLLVGSDTIVELPSWWRADDLVQEVEFVGFERPGTPLHEICRVEEHFGAEVADRIRCSIITAPLLEASATQVRERVREGRSIRYMVPEAVRQHILARGLYAAG
jgi:nicotinate-nucleotide adenylyltransferase